MIDLPHTRPEGRMTEPETIGAWIEPPAGACPRCGEVRDLGTFRICAPCAALMGWDPQCPACLIEQTGKPAGDLRHVPTCQGRPT